jgi:hypothetical protein
MNTNRNLRQTRKNEIQRLSQEIENLSTQLNQLIIEDNQDREEVLPIVNPNIEEELQEGDRIVITNNYRGQRGSQGVVTHVTPKQVSIRIDGQRRVVNKKKTNVRKI